VHQPGDDGACTCPDCGKGMARLGEDVTEVLDYVPGHFQVIRHIGPKYACTACDAITEAPAPEMPTPRGRATPGTLAHLLVAIASLTHGSARAKSVSMLPILASQRPRAVLWGFWGRFRAARRGNGRRSR